LSNRAGQHVPLRTCVVCGDKTSKENLLRLVAPPQGGVETDPSGKAPGRGAYVCKGGDCAQGPGKRSRIDFALRRRMSDKEWSDVGSAIEAVKTT
jgi:hypothetical protein